MSTQRKRRGLVWSLPARLQLFCLSPQQVVLGGLVEGAAIAAVLDVLVGRPAAVGVELSLALEWESQR